MNSNPGKRLLIHISTCRHLDPFLFPQDGYSHWQEACQTRTLRVSDQRSAQTRKPPTTDEQVIHDCPVFTRCLDDNHLTDSWFLNSGCWWNDEVMTKDSKRKEFSTLLKAKHTKIRYIDHFIPFCLGFLSSFDHFLNPKLPYAALCSWPRGRVQRAASAAKGVAWRVLLCFIWGSPGFYHHCYFSFLTSWVLCSCNIDPRFDLERSF